jgi:hypothetical protein
MDSYEFYKKYGYDIFVSERDYNLRQIKKRRLNPPCQNVYLKPDGSVEREEDKIIAAQRIFRHNYYKPDGKGYQKVMASFKEKTLSE